MWYKSFRLSDKRLDKLSDIASDLALVSIASVVLPAVFDKYDLAKIIIGVIVSISFWLFSLWIRR